MYFGTMERSEIISSIREVLPQLQQEFGIYRIGLFGSYARQQHTAKSDIDLVYKLEVEKRLKKRLGKKKIEFINYRYLNPVIRVEVLKDVIYV